MTGEGEGYEVRMLSRIIIVKRAGIIYSKNSDDREEPTK